LLFYYYFQLHIVCIDQVQISINKKGKYK